MLIVGALQFHNDLVIFVHANQDKLEALQSCLPITYELVRSSSQLLKIL
jgi:hypothetical protein